MGVGAILQEHDCVSLVMKRGRGYFSDARWDSLLGWSPGEAPTGSQHPEGRVNGVPPAWTLPPVSSVVFYQSTQHTVRIFPWSDFLHGCERPEGKGSSSCVQLGTLSVYLRAEAAYMNENNSKQQSPRGV